MEPGKVKRLRVVREVPFGFFLSNGEEDILLHRSEVNDEITLDEELDVFIFQDHEGRLAATLTIPSVQIDLYDWVEVVEVNKKLGVFVDIGLKKDILVSMDDLPALFELWPEKGDKLYCSLKVDNKNRLFGKLGTENVMRSISKPADRSAFNKNVSGHIYRLLLEGSFLITEEGYLGFIHSSERKREPRLGEKVSGRIIDVKVDGSINISLLPRTHEQMDDDANTIYDYLQSRGGSMPYWDKSLPEEINKRFNMRKAAFKRALGRLMKEGKITQEDGWTHLKNK
ncbi:S1 RNA-binding domain-containing protein [Lederbergia graminis]|uniref:S1 RNA-binding domain-containing protein n=1 Tax=Lederbergia graminis TaxID=735518 RepID=A0ABW0LHG2_9BACI